MKVGGSAGAGAAGAVGGARRPAAQPGFAPAGASSVGSASAAAPSASVSAPVGVEALLAMQETGGPLERRRRALARGGRVLDGLDAVRLALLDGEAAPAGVLDRLQRAVREAREQVGGSAGEPIGDDGLDEVLDAIDLRAQVELAKAEVARQAA